MRMIIGDDYMSLRGKKAVVTGAGKGIGRALAVALAKEGVHVGLITRTAADLESLSHDLIHAYGIQVSIAPADISQRHEVEAAVNKITQELGTVDILINNAGIAVIPGYRNIEQLESSAKAADLELADHSHLQA